MTILRRLFYALPPSLRFLTRRLYYLPADLLQQFARGHSQLAPPKGLIYTGSGDFKQQGETWLNHFKEVGGLQPHHHVLDIGSGIGRIAIPLTQFLDNQARYEGFDVVKLGVQWCEKNITSKYPHFNFTYIPLDNDLYRSRGLNSANFRFPYEDNAFDFIILTSVFTHMLPEEVENYLKEIHRVLRPGGTCMATFFIWNAASEKHSPSNPSFQFPYDYHHYRLMDDKVKSANVAYLESYLQTKIQTAGLSLDQTFYGFWSGQKKATCMDFQDVVVMRKI
ncbi:MAG: class I SAM-dependent methyltransferase [Saprospiraceae bacterium]